MTAETIDVLHCAADQLEAHHQWARVTAGWRPGFRDHSKG
jgi:hypothetical protein